MIRAVKSQFDNYSKLNKKISSEVLSSIDENDNPSKISELQELETWNTKFSVASQATEGFFSKRRVHPEV